MEALAESPRWQALMHINNGATLRDAGRSYADDPDFFLAEDGKRDPAAELRASRQALRPAGSLERCRFPARYRFLAEQLGWDETDPLAHCGDYREWRDQMPLGQLVLVFPAAYLNSPSSMFGHTLLRLDAQPEPESVWLSRAINFGANVNPDETSLLYVYRGVISGYGGEFSIVPYIDKIQEYSHLENRDIWEYSLNLDRDELDWLVRHLWELKGINFDYYFFDENCSFRLLELIRVARPQALPLDRLRFAELPVHTVRALYDAQLVTDRRYRPSKAEQLERLLSRLNASELALAKALKRQPDLAESERFKARAPERRHLIANVAYQALRLEYRDQERTQAVAADSLALLRIVQRNPAPELEPLPAPAAPETGHATETFSLGAGRRGDRAFLELGYRMTYHDLLDPLTGFLPGAGIEGLDIRLRVEEDEGLLLERLDLVNIRSLSPHSAFQKPISWFVHGGLEQAHRRERRGTTLFIQGGPGASWQLAGVQPYAFAVARAESVSGVAPAVHAGVGAQFGLLYTVPGLQIGLQTERLEFTEDFYRQRTGVTANLPVNRNNAGRLNCDHTAWRGGDENVCLVSWRHFFE